MPSQLASSASTPLVPILHHQGPLLLMMDESKQPYSQTHKDRRSVSIVEEALRLGIHGLGIITAGNAGLSLARVAGTRLQVCAIVSQQISPTILSALRGAGASIEFQDLSRHLPPSDVIALASRHIAGRIHDVTDGYESAYASMIDELYEARPDVVVCPVGSGQLLLNNHNMAYTGDTFPLPHMYSIDFRKRVFTIKAKEQLTFEQTSLRFNVGMRTLFAWQQRLEPKMTRNKPATKIDMKALKSDVRRYPDRFQWERAQDYGVTAWAIGKALRRLNISVKKNSVSPQDRRRAPSAI